MTTYAAVIGLEVHAQLSTRSKLFCACPTQFGAAPNQNTCPVCLGFPGVLPVVNARAVELAVRAGLALGCTVHRRSVWARKNYFYPDLPKGYQISQYDRPLCTDGALTVEVDGPPRAIGIARLHMEEDAGKSVHDDPRAHGRSTVDFNRAGVPLVEIVSRPELRSAAEAAEYLRRLRQLLRYLDVCDGNMEEGSLRCDANVSVRPVGQAELGTRTETKNINSFRFVEQAVDYEIARQIEVLRAGGRVVQETRLWDSQARMTRPLRSKEEAHDYRYFPEPDLPELAVEEAFVEAARRALPELPQAKLRRYVADLGLEPEAARVLVEERAVAEYFEATLRLHANARALCNWVVNELLRELKGRELAEIALTPAALAELVALVDEGAISGKIAKELFAELLAHGGSPRRLVDARGLRQVSDAGALAAQVAAVLAAHPDVVDSYRAGKAGVLGFLVGQVMKATGGKANPKLVNELLREQLK